MKSIILVSVFLTLHIFALDLTKNQTLYYNWEVYCKNHPGQYESTIDLAPNGKTLVVTPTNWLNETAFTCNPIDYDPSLLPSDDELDKLLGESLMPLIKDKNQILFYNCTYDEDSYELVFLVNGQKILTFFFIEDNCQISFSPAIFYDFTTLNFQGQAKNDKNCKGVVFEGNLKLYNFTGLQSPYTPKGLGDEIEGSLTLRADNITGGFVVGDMTNAHLQCNFESLGVFYAISCPSENFFLNYQMFGVFLLDNGDVYVFGQGEETATHLPCIQYIKSGQIALLSIVLLVAQALFSSIF